MSATVARLFQTLSQGVYVVGVSHAGLRNAFTAAAVMQVSFNPPLLALSINPHHSSYGLLKQGQGFSVNVLKKSQLELAAHYARPASTDKLAFMEWTPGRTGAPLLHGVMAWFECKVTEEHLAGDHMLVLGKVIDGQLLDLQAEPMTYRDTGAMDAVADLFPDALRD